MAEHLTLDGEGHPEERAHRRVVFREATRGGVLRYPVQPQWPGVVGQQPNHATHPTALRQSTDPLRQTLISAHVHKGCERVTVRCE
ncbi:MAG TPA: hypothetical protein VIY28_06070 [Pseudonocardiaceae bacterium]